MSTNQKPKFGTKVLDAINDRIDSQPTAKLDETAATEEAVWVSFTTAVTKETYMKLKQAEYWVPGFLFKEVTEAALVKELENYPEASKELPPAALQKLLKSSKKLQ
ncbi:hypothetical protein DNI29_23030 [Hymenobacter sediminis]|uniref:hypothetical protein n=1 Tax=Hymenobacter sediminis TaxID=2218621 RepID=UPI000DA68F7E|nr:hypothetical protein [Hymenobacter sediminis]RPD43737.1 hypothetical protein DNI29_23030 [Hymenobacter sediminis]